MSSSTNSPSIDTVQDPRVLAFGAPMCNGSIPTGALREEIVYPVSSNFSDGATIEMRALPSRTSGIDLSKAYLLVDWHISGSTDPNSTTLADSYFLTYNVCRLFKQASLYLSSTAVEVVNDVPSITDHKLLKISKVAGDTSLSDVLIGPFTSSVDYSNDRSSCGANRAVRGNGLIGQDIVKFPHYDRRFASVGSSLYAGGETITKKQCRVPLSLIFGFASIPQFLPASLIQVLLTLGNTQDFVLPVNTTGNATRHIDRISLVLTHYELTNEASALLEGGDVTLAVPHWRTLTYSISNGTSGNILVNIQTYAGLEAVDVRYRTNGTVDVYNTGNPNLSTLTVDIPWESCMPCGVESALMNYRGRQSPMSAGDIVFTSNRVPVTGGIDGLTQATIQAYVFFERFITSKGIEYNGMQAGDTAGSSINLMDWFKTNHELCFNLVEEGCSLDTMSGPLSLQINLSGTSALPVVFDDTIGSAGIYSKEINTVGISSGIVIIRRTNLIKYSSDTRNFIFLSNGAS